MGAMPDIMALRREVEIISGWVSSVLRMTWTGVAGGNSSKSNSHTDAVLETPKTCPSGEGVGQVKARRKENIAEFREVKASMISPWAVSVGWSHRGILIKQRRPPYMTSINASMGSVSQARGFARQTMQAEWSSSPQKTRSCLGTLGGCVCMCELTRMSQH